MNDLDEFYRVCGEYKALIQAFEDKLKEPLSPQIETHVRLSIKDLSQNLFMLKLDALRLGAITQKQYDDI